MSRLALGLALALVVGLASSATAQTTLVILNPDNGYTDEVEPGVVLRRDPVSGKGPLLGGTVLEFSCGSCDVATFDDAVSQVGGSIRVCELRPVEIVLLDAQICMRSTVTGNRYDVDLLTWDSRSFPCQDADGGTSCANSGGYASYIRSPFTPATDPLGQLEELISGVAGFDLPEGTEQSLMAKLHGAWTKLSDQNPDNDGAAINKLQAFVSHVEAQSGKSIPEDDATALIDAAQAIMALLSGA